MRVLQLGNDNWEKKYTVPEDIMTKVERLRETKESLIDLVSVTCIFKILVW